MNSRLRIAVADDEPLMLKFYDRMFAKLGHDVALRAADGAALLNGCLREAFELVVTDIRMPLLDGIDVARQLWSEAPQPMVLVSALHDPQTLQRAQMDHVLAYLVKPIGQSELREAVALAVRHRRELQVIEAETATRQETFQASKLIQQAKLLLIKRGGFDDDSSFRRIEKLAREWGCKMGDVARTLVDAEKAFLPP